MDATRLELDEAHGSFDEHGWRDDFFSLCFGVDRLDLVDRILIHLCHRDKHVSGLCYGLHGCCLKKRLGKVENLARRYDLLVRCDQKIKPFEG